MVLLLASGLWGNAVVSAVWLLIVGMSRQYSNLEPSLHFCFFFLVAEARKARRIGRSSPQAADNLRTCRKGFRYAYGRIL
jgi:hypothetical protein